MRPVDEKREVLQTGRRLVTNTFGRHSGIALAIVNLVKQMKSVKLVTGNILLLDRDTTWMTRAIGPRHCGSQESMLLLHPFIS